MPINVSLVYEKSSGQVLGLVSRVSVEDGSGDPATMLGPGVVIHDPASWAPLVTVASGDVDVLALDVSSDPNVWNSPKSHQVVDGTPALQSAVADAVVSKTKVEFNTAPPAGEKVGVFAQIEGSTLDETIIHSRKTDTANYALPLSLQPGQYTYVVLVQGRLPLLGSLTVAP